MSTSREDALIKLIQLSETETAETTFVAFKLEHNGEGCAVFLNDRSVNFSNGHSRPYKVPKNRPYLLQVELIGEIGNTVKVEETMDRESYQVVINTTIPAGSHPLKSCNGPICRFLTLQPKLPGAPL